MKIMIDLDDIELISELLNKNSYETMTEYYINEDFEDKDDIARENFKKSLHAIELDKKIQILVDTFNRIQGQKLIFTIENDCIKSAEYGFKESK